MLYSQVFYWPTRRTQVQCTTINLRHGNTFRGVVKFVKIFLGAVNVSGLIPQAHYSSKHVRSGATEKQPA